MKEKTKAVLFIICSGFCFSWMNAFVRLSGDLPSVEKSFFRNLVALVVAAVMLWRSGEGLRAHPQTEEPRRQKKYNKIKKKKR